MMRIQERVTALEKRHKTFDQLVQLRLLLIVSVVLTLMALLAVGYVVFQHRDPIHHIDGDAIPHTAHCDGGTPKEKGAEALALIKYPWKNLNYKVQFHSGRKGYLALTYLDENRIEVFVRSCQSIASVANTLGHEFGHAVDDRFNNDQRRAEWKAIRGFDAPWFGCSRCSDYGTGAGDFAEVFAFLHAPPGRFRSQLAEAPDDAQAIRLEKYFYP